MIVEISDRNIKINKGNYNEHVNGDYIEAKASQEEDENVKQTNAEKSLRMLGRITKVLPATAAFITKQHL